ncbi:MAG: glycosyltransferase [Nanoarchaeota archaeon]|nr:glycosyltransferase [Nanoarchaeota archaeon]
MKRLVKYLPIIGERQLERIRKEAKPLEGKHIIHINSTYYGGGVAEMLNSLVPLFNDLGINMGWRLLKGSPDFFSITKKFHNALQGEDINLTAMKKKIYLEVNRTNSEITHIAHHDAVIVHDPQPLPLINYYKKTQPWIWRCHIDLSRPNRVLMNYLKTFIERYDKIIISKSTFKHNFKVPQEVIYPSIDPLSTKNIEMADWKVHKYMKKYGCDTDKPIISQISRFDKWKDPLGVIRAFRMIREKVDCRLVLLGSMATDDPEGQKLYEQVLEAAKGDKDIKVINFENDTLVNALQRASAVVIQKSLKEGFGLTVSEALWKKKPVVAMNVGGIHLQIKNGYNGYLVNSEESTARAVVALLKNPKRAEQMGERGHNVVKKNFLITRHLMDYITLLKKHIIHYKV